jgi:predicted secreted protein
VGADPVEAQPSRPNHHHDLTRYQGVKNVSNFLRRECRSIGGHGDGELATAPAQFAENTDMSLVPQDD